MSTCYRKHRNFIAEIGAATVSAMPKAAYLVIHDVRVNQGREHCCPARFPKLLEHL